MLVINLTAEQCEALADARKALAIMEADKAPGMVVAQIFGDHMKIGVIDHKKARALQVAFGKTCGSTARTAYDDASCAADDAAERLANRRRRVYRLRPC